jgi:heme-degrading monooxygenase HmoA
MSIIIHITGKADASATALLGATVQEIRPILEREPGFEGAQLLVNHQEHKAQVLLFWESYEAGMAFLKNSSVKVFEPFVGLMLESVGPMFFAIEGRA